MKLLQKILFVIIIGLVAWNEDVHGVAVLDLPANTPGLQSSKQPKKICGITKECLHVIVPHSEAYKTISSKKTSGKQFKKHQLKKAIQEALLDEGNIYFPINGHQPTTAEAAQYSCANVVSDHVTDWYIRAFGGNAGLELSYGRDAPVADPAPQMGFAVVGGAAHIITVVVAGRSVDFGRQFWQTFRTISSNPIGRVLLYRILIEIRRHNDGKGSVENSVLVNTNPIMLAQRNNRRSIVICHGDNSYYKNFIYFKHDNTITVNTVSNRNVNNAVEIVRHQRTSEIGLLHEMLHWFHALRDYKRYCLDGNNTYNRQEFANTITPHQITNGTYQSGVAYQIDIANHHYNGIAPVDNARRLVSARPWDGDYEEMRVILGVPDGYSAHFKNGDDLSENLYRLSKANIPDRNMRFGHVELGLENGTLAGNIIGNHEYFEDYNIINNYIASIQNHMINPYLPGRIFNLPAIGTATDSGNLVNNGLGNCRVK